MAAARRRSIEDLSEEELTERINQLQRELGLRPALGLGSEVALSSHKPLLLTLHKEN
jgi:hypothetical protein